MVLNILLSIGRLDWSPGKHRSSLQSHCSLRSMTIACSAYVSHRIIRLRLLIGRMASASIRALQAATYQFVIPATPNPFSRKRSNSASTVSVGNNARPLPMTQHHHHHHHHQYAPGAKSKGPDRALTPIATSATTSADQEVDKFFKASVNSATSSSTDEQYDMKNTTTNSINGREGDADSGSGSLCYIASNSFKQEAQLLEAIHIPPTYHNGPRHHENHSFIPAIQAEDFLATNQIHPCNHDYQCHMQHDDHGENDCFNVDPSLHMCDMVYDHHESLSDPSSISASADHDYKYNEGYSMDGNCSDTTQKNVLMMHAHTDYDGCCYMDSPSKLDVLINGRFTPPNTFMSGQSESSTSPLSGILTAATTTGLERPPSNPRPGSQCKSNPYSKHKNLQLLTLIE